MTHYPDIHTRARQLVTESRGALTLREAYAELSRRGQLARIRAQGRDGERDFSPAFNARVANARRPRMNLRDLSEEVARLAATMHGLTDTNIAGVSVESGAVMCEADISALENQIADLRTGEEALTQEVKELTEENRTLTERAVAAEALIDEVKTEDEKGATLRQYAQRCEQAEESARRYRYAMEDAIRERDALRKKKGVTVNLFKCEDDILRLLRQIEAYPGEMWRVTDDAKALRSKLFAK